MRSDASTVEAYIAALPEDRAKAVTAVRRVMLDNLPEGYGETMNWGMISYEVPLERSGKTYNGKPLMYAGLANQKNHIAVYLHGLYCIEAVKTAFLEAHKDRKLDMGKSCIRFKNMDQIDLDAVASAIAAVPVDDYIEAARH